MSLGVFPPVLQLFKAGQVHGILKYGIIFTELLGCLACLYSWVGGSAHTCPLPAPASTDENKSTNT